MAISHRTNRLKLLSQPSVTQLQNGRYRLVVSAAPLNPRNDWYNDNKSRIFADFGTLESAAMSVDGIDPRSGEAYTDMRLTDVQSQGQGDDYVVQFTYETLGSTFVQVKDDTIDYELNGLRRVQRESIAQAGTDFQKTVGVTTITSQIDNETAVTLYLAGYEVDDTDSYRKVTETYIEAGTLAVNSRNLSEGVKQVATTFLAVEGSTTGPVVSRSTGDFSGLKTITVTNLQDKDGNSIVDGGTNLVHDYESFQQFSYPGVAEINLTIGTVSSTPNSVNFAVVLDKPPVQCKVKATTYVFFQTSNSIAQADYTYDSSSGLWSPNSWAAYRVSGTKTNSNGFSDSAALRGYRTESTGTSGAVQDVGGILSSFKVEGVARITGGTISYILQTENGPPDPINSKWVLDVDIRPAFDDVDGNTYYKKTIVVTEAIPDQVDDEVPYD